MDQFFDMWPISGSWSWISGIIDWLFAFPSIGVIGIAALLCLCCACCIGLGIIAFNPFSKS